MSYCTFDLETTIKSSFKRKANPFDPANFIVAVGWKFKGNEKPSMTYRKDGKLPFDWFTKLLQGTRILVGQNIKFDILYALREPQNLEAWMDWVAKGGVVWDCQLAEFLLEGMRQEVHMLSLDELALKYGGNVKGDEGKKLWDAGVDTPDIPQNLLQDYLIGRTNEVTGQYEQGDIGNTELVFLGQLERARAAGQVKSILLNMGSLLCTIEMERNGMAIDLPLGLELAAESQAKLNQMQEELQQYLPKDIPFEFNWTNRFHLSPLIFGGVVRYDVREWDLADGTTTLHNPEDYPDKRHLYAWGTKDEVHAILKDGSTVALDHPDWLVLTDDGTACERNKGGKNKGEIKTKKVKVPDYTKPKTRMAKYEYRFPGYTTPNKEWASSTEGLYSVAGEVIEALGSRDIPFLKLLSSVALLTKDLTTYYISTDPVTGESKGMLSLCQEKEPGLWIIHHRLNHTSTVTARFSSSDPNLQNIPKGKKSQVKRTFVSRYSRNGAKGYIIQSDFTSLEVYIQAILTKCKQLISDLKLGLDMHCLRVSQVEGMEYEAVFKLARIDGDPVWDNKRTEAKVFSFQRAYGAGAQKISDSTGIPLEVVMALIEAEEKRYPEIVEYFEKRTEEIKRNRQPTNMYVMHPEVPGLRCQLGRSWARTPDNKVYSYRESPSPKFLVKKGITSSFSPTEIKNYEVQGGGGEWAKAAMWLAIREFYRTRNFGGRACLVNQVHDALYADAHEDVKDEAAAVLHACMEAASEFMEWYFSWEVPVPVPTETVVGANMMEEGHPCDNHKELAALARKNIRQLYMNGYVPSFEKETT
ncbi:DNA polymerase [Aquamicrobium phage P14]|uniref:DNA polymerase n=1 Tax=Aquamicrobium phage P14 TaxID=1927013 RepID=A0A1L5C075_9CAUD|nr:DNA polymerase [Aquamicrobium phage P14]APL99481.1 putative DNA polymerase [Aquamicrobium phage P14]